MNYVKHFRRLTYFDIRCFYAIWSLWQQQQQQRRRKRVENKLSLGFRCTSNFRIDISNFVCDVRSFVRSFFLFHHHDRRRRHQHHLLCWFYTIAAHEMQFQLQIQPNQLFSDKLEFARLNSVSLLWTVICTARCQWQQLSAFPTFCITANLIKSICRFALAFYHLHVHLSISRCAHKDFHKRE